MPEQKTVRLKLLRRRRKNNGTKKEGKDAC
jgi:hypothetical protein